MKSLFQKLFGRAHEMPDGDLLAAEEEHEAEVRRSPGDTEGGTESPSGDPPAAEPWIGVDLDGTLAHYDGWGGLNRIGKPIPRMVRRVETWIEAGFKVKVFTARASLPGGAESVHSWLAKHGLPPLEVTNEKDLSLIEFWDDRAVQVLPNSGRAILRPMVTSLPKTPLLPEEQEGETFVREARVEARRPGEIEEQGETGKPS